MKDRNHFTPLDISDHLKKLGIGTETLVLCYDNSSGYAACRGAFLL